VGEPQIDLGPVRALDAEPAGQEQELIGHAARRVQGDQPAVHLIGEADPAGQCREQVDRDLGRLAHALQQRLARQDQDLGRLQGGDIRRAPPFVEETHLSKQLTGRQHRDPMLLPLGGLVVHFDLAGEDHVERDARLVALQDGCLSSEAILSHMPADESKLGWSEAGEKRQIAQRYDGIHCVPLLSIRFACPFVSAGQARPAA
jgi:hypothetical protein